jgi:ribonuclease D
VNVELVDRPEAVAPLCERIEAAGLVAFDTEFHGERYYAPRLMIAQIAIGDQIAIVDAVKLADLTPLARALNTVTVIGHALQSDLKILADRFDLLPHGAFDTQLAAAFCGYGLSISLGDLVHAILDVRLKKAHTISDWSARPISAEQMTYLVDDVAYLHRLREALGKQLAAKGRASWFEEEAVPLVDLHTYRSDPERLYLRISGANRMSRRELAVLRELAMFRDATARERDVPPKYIVPDDAISSLVHLRPKSIGELGQLRRLDAGMRRTYGQAIVDAIARGLALPDAELPSRPPRPQGGDRDGIAALLSVLVAQVAGDRDLPSALLAPRSSLERIARELPASKEELAELLPGPKGANWRADVIAEPLWELLEGRVSLGISGARAGAPRVSVAPGGRGDPILRDER